MRNDLESMTAGRCMAQANHAASVLEHDFGENSECRRQEVRDWKHQTKQGFGTCIVLAASKEQIDAIFNGPLKRWIMKGKVIDPDYGVRTSWELFSMIDRKKYHRWVSSDTLDSKSVTFFRKEMTCAYVMGTKEELAPFLGDLPLY